MENSLNARAHLAHTMAAEPVEAFLAALDASPKTKETYRRNLRAWTSHLQAQGLAVLQATRADVMAYKAELTATKKPATVNAYLTAVRRLYGYLEALGAYPNIAADVKGVRMNAHSSKDALTVDQARRLLSRGHGEGLAELRDAAMLCLMLRRGLRTVEVARADVGDLRQIDGEAVLYLQGKGYADKGDFIVLNESCLRPIYAYLDARREAGEEITPKSPLFAGHGNRNRGGRMTTRSISRMVAEAYREEGMASARLTAHSLRHTAVTLALKGGATVQEAQAMARHKSIETTMIYAHNLERLEAAAEHSIDALLDA